MTVGADILAAFVTPALAWGGAAAMAAPIVPRGALVLVGGGLSLVATNPMPTGWYVVGRTPERLFARDREPPFLIAPGDAIRFEPVDAASFAALEARVAHGETVARREAAA